MRTRLILLIIWGFIMATPTFGQQLAITGSNASFKKGNIETDVLMELIQQKQQEVKQRVFRNLVVNNFNKFLGDETALSNFTTYYYTYSIFDVLTSGKSKQNLSKELIQNAVELSYIYSLAWYSYLENYNKFQVEKYKDGYRLISVNNFNKSMNSRFRNILGEDAKLIKGKDGRVTIDESEEVMKKKYLINLILDVSFDVLLKESSAERFKFKSDTTDSEFMAWYKVDNFYLKELEEASKAKRPDSPNVSAALISLRDLVQQDYNTLSNDSNGYKVIVQSFKNLRSGNLGLDSLSEQTTQTVRSLLYLFSKLTKQRYDNDVVSVLFDLILSNITSDQDLNGRRIVYVEAEAIISSLYDEYTKVAERLGWNKYFSPVLNIGANYTHFVSGNNLAKNDDGTTTSLKNLVFASEKIGIKYKICNWNFTRSQPPGKPTSYYRKNFSWLRPQPKPIVSDLFVSAYVSGLLYNVVNVKTNKNFDYGIFGGAIGLTFFNSLEVSANVGAPFLFTKPKEGESAFNSKNTFIGLAFDLPLVEYINALANKKKKL